MPIITLFKFEEKQDVDEVYKALNGKKLKDAWITAKKSKYTPDEVMVQFWYWEDVESILKKAFGENYDEEIVTYLKRNGKDKVLKKVYCFINTLTQTLEVYRGPDAKTKEIVATLENLLRTGLIPLTLDATQLREVYVKHSTELCQALFKGIHGLFYNILRGRRLELNPKFKQYVKDFPECLRVISFRPRIRFLNSWNRYQVTLNGDKGTLRMSANEFGWRPRFEIRQIVFLVATTTGLL